MKVTTPTTPMSAKEASTILREFNKWRRAEAPYDKLNNKFAYSTRELGLAIELAVEILDSAIEQ